MPGSMTFDALNEAWAQQEPSPADGGSVELIVRRPAADEREELQSARFTAADGLHGDDWRSRVGATASPDTQVTLMNSRVIHLITADQARWAASGDQLFVDLDLSHDNLPAGTRLQIGGVVMEISSTPHTGCGKFARRFGAGARKWVMTEAGCDLRLRGVYARVIQDGVIQRGDVISKL